MKKGILSYSCFSEKGEEALPSDAFINKFHQQDIEPIIFLDSCVCLHIVKVIDFEKFAKNVDFARIIALKEYLERHPNIKISPFFALLELCSQKGEFDKEKLQDFKLRIDFFEQIPLKIFKSFKYDFRRDVFVFRNIPDLKKNPLSIVNPVLKNNYCALLKIRSISLNGLTKDKAEKNLNEFIDWLINDLEIFRGAEYKLAMHVFGGNTAFRKMIGLDCKPAEVKRKLIGTTWDLFHSKFTANSFRLFQVLKRNIYPYFLTSDSNLFKIFQNLSLTVIKDGRDDIVSSFLLTSDFSYPHFDESFINRNNEKLITAFVDRCNLKYSFDAMKVNKLINELELQNGVVSLD
ncbi:hypothetical protein [Olivibacter domesticus]|uniref:Uncharacterized protein n=1 Tax=Olivibacter domesticus TaxID=407022 RepID=A0A1H7JQ71_OLID1|nr:hypothetical protein [Olivibacter domesticus]SEK76466.1 hypothetical protein SAMN05661044_01087 [Olivibacter domesticus]